MSKFVVIIALSFVFIQSSFSQYRDVPYETKTKLKTNNLIFGFINPKNFSITHSINLSYLTFGNNSVSLTSYTGSLNYKILNNLSVGADVTMQYSPFASIGNASSQVNKDFQNSLSGIYLSRVSLNYKPAKNVFINIQYLNNKNNYGYYNNPYSLWNDF